MAKIPVDIVAQVEACLEQRLPKKNTRIYLACSGGQDSQVLLDILSQLPAWERVGLLHFNHGTPAAEQFIAHVEQLAKCYQKALRLCPLGGIDERQGLEAGWHHARLNVLKSLLGDDEVVLFAHHQRDQAETLLLQLLRGAGLAGLSGMPVEQALGQGWLLRPLLQTSKESITHYARVRRLDWCEDPSNQDLNIQRNRLRAQCWPLILDMAPGAEAAIARSARHCQEASDLLRQYLPPQSPTRLTLSTLESLSPSAQTWVWRDWIQSFGVVPPSEKKLLEIQRQMCSARGDKLPCVEFGHWAVRRYRGECVLTPHPLPKPPASQRWEMQSPLEIEGVGVLSLREGIPTIKEVTVHFGANGVWLRMPNGQHRALKKCFGEWGVPPWLRGLTPLIFQENVCISVVGYWCIHKDFQFIWKNTITELENYFP